MLGEGKTPTRSVVDCEGDRWECFDAQPLGLDAKYQLIVVGRVLSRQSLENLYGPLSEGATA